MGAIGVSEGLCLCDEDIHPSVISDMSSPIVFFLSDESFPRTLCRANLTFIF